MIKQVFFVLVTSLFGIFAINSTDAATFKLPSSGNVIGQITQVRANHGETLLDIARRYDIGVSEIRSYNHQMGLHQPLRRGTVITIPSRFVLPPGPRQGIVLNLAQMRLYYYHPEQGTVDTYPVGVGRQGWSTPRGATRVISKAANPTWHPPISIRREAARKGKYLPLSIGPGPRNPLGHYAIYLGFRGILIHGTIQPASIGTRSSHGCIRMFPRNIQQLFNSVAVGTPVRILYQSN